MFSVVFLGIRISVENKIPTKLKMIFMTTFSLFHEINHRSKVPTAANPNLFILAFVIGKTTPHLLIVLIGYFLIKNNKSLILLLLKGVSFTIYGIYLPNQIF